MSMTDYIIQAETAITALRNAGETLSDGLWIVMILEGLPDAFKSFSIHVTQSDVKMAFAKFKTELRSYESTTKFSTVSTDDDSVMRVRGRSSGDLRLTCYSCGQKGHKASTVDRDSGAVFVGAPQTKMGMQAEEKRQGQAGGG